LWPVYRGSSGQVLWGQGNPWRTAWDRGGFGVRYIDLANVDASQRTLSADAAAGGDLTASARSCSAIIHGRRWPRRSRGWVQPHGDRGEIFDSTGPKGTQTLPFNAAAPASRPTGAPDRSFQAFRCAPIRLGHPVATGLVGYASSAEGDSGQAASGARTLYWIAVPVGSITDWLKIRDPTGRDRPCAAPLRWMQLIFQPAGRSARFRGRFSSRFRLLWRIAATFLAQLSPPDASGPGDLRAEAVGCVSGRSGALGQTAPRVLTVGLRPFRCNDKAVGASWAAPDHILVITRGGLGFAGLAAAWDVAALYPGGMALAYVHAPDRRPVGALAGTAWIATLWCWACFVGICRSGDGAGRTVDREPGGPATSDVTQYLDLAGRHRILPR